MTFIDTNEKLKGICDDYINNQLIFNGSFPENIIKDTMNDNWYCPLSMNHGVLISDEHPDDYGYFENDIKKSTRYINSKKSTEHSYFYYLNQFVKYLPSFKWKGDIDSNSEINPQNI